MAVSGPTSPNPRWRARRDYGGWVARGLCALFAVIGAVPLALGLLVRLRPVRAWAAAETETLLSRALGVHASYRLRLTPWPLTIALGDVRVPANDGGSPFLIARRVTIRPRLFALFDGKLDTGDIRVDEPKIRAVLRDGRLANLDYRLPAETTSRAGRLPLSALSLSDGDFDLTLLAPDSLARVRVRQADVDLSVDDTAVLSDEGREPVDLSLETGPVAVDWRHADPEPGAVARFDEDSLCAVHLRARVSGTELTIRRLDATGAVDLDPAPDSRPSCRLPADDWRRFELHLAAMRAAFAAPLWSGGGLDSLSGRVRLRAPVPLAHRFAALPPTTGWLELDADSVEWGAGRELPSLRGHLAGAALGFDTKVIADTLAAQVESSGDRVKLADIAAAWGGGQARIDRAVVRPLAAHAPLEAGGIRVRGVSFPALFDAFSGSPNAHVAWTLDKVSLERFGGTLVPLALAGPMVAETRDFSVYDRPAWQDKKKRLLAIPTANITGSFEVQPQGLLLNRFAIQLPRSRLTATVDLHFNEQLGITVFDGSTVDLADVSPLADVDLKGVARLSLEAGGHFTDPLIHGKIAIDRFFIQGFPIGSLGGQVQFEPVNLRLTEATVAHGKSALRVPELSLDFGKKPASLILSGKLDSTGQGLSLRDFLEMIREDGDARFAGVWGRARGSAEVSYVLGGPQDRCGGGKLAIGTRMQLSDVSVAGQHFDSGEVDLDYLWDDIPAGDHGLSVDVHSAVLRTGGGAIVARATIRHDAEVEADLTAAALPLSAIDALGYGAAAKSRVVPEGTASAVGRLSGTLPRMRGDFDVAISTVRIGPATLPASKLRVLMVPEPAPVAYEGTSECGHRIRKPAGSYQPSAVGRNKQEEKKVQHEAARPDGDEPASYEISEGQLFGGQLSVDDLVISRSDRPAIRQGGLLLHRLDLGALANLLPGVAFSAGAPRGRLSAEIRLEQVPLDAPMLGEARAQIDELALERDGTALAIGRVKEPVKLSGDALVLPELPLHVTPRRGLPFTVTVSGRVDELSQIPQLDLSAQLEPIDLSLLVGKLAGVSRAEGVIKAGMHLGGNALLPQLTGDATLAGGMLRLTSVPLPLDDVNVHLTVRDNEIAVKQASAKIGASGVVDLSGRIPLSGLSIAEANLALAARDVALPLADGVKATADATLKIAYQPSAEAALPHISGTVSLTRFTYSRPMALKLDLDSLTGKGKTAVDAYDPKNDLFSFDLSVQSPRPLRISNNLIDAGLDVVPPGLVLSGTNQRFGAKGALNLEPSSKFFLQGHDFHVREGKVEFDNLQRVMPRLDVTAETEYHRYATNASEAVASSSDAAASASNSGIWRIRMHATGDTDSPHVQFSSDPPLSQDDIVLLLEVGMTRAELDRGLASSLAQSVGLDALSALTGFDQALKKTVPLIDDFRVGSQYSARTGKPEPTLSVGKRITDDVRATVTTGLSDDAEVRSDVEWKLSRTTSVQATYDNVNDVSSSALGNIGADLRWRLEFE